MERDSSEQPTPSLQSETNEVLKIIAVDMLPEVLGFIETDALKEVKALLIEAATSGELEEAKLLTLRYLTLGQDLVEKHQGYDFPRAQIGLSIAMSLIRRNVGRIDDYIEDLEDALTYARNMGYDDVSYSLELAIQQATENSVEELSSEAIAAILRNLGEDLGFDDQTCDEIAEQPFEVAFETAYGYLVQAGQDPDELLAPFMDNNPDN